MKRLVLTLVLFSCIFARAQTRGSIGNFPIGTPGTGATYSDVVYAKLPGTTLHLDVYEPEKKSAAPLPAVILIHGGGWTSFDKSVMAGMAIFLAQHNYVAFTIDYRLLSGNKNEWPVQLDDAQRAVRWVRAHAAKYNVDPNRIGAFGHSAGAQIASLLGELNTRDNSDPSLAAYSSKVNAVVEASGPADFTSSHDAETQKFLDQLFGATLQANPGLWKSASPALMIRKDAAPFLIVHGTLDKSVPISQSEEFAANLEKSGVPVTFVKVADNHVFVTDVAKFRLESETLQFFNKYLK